MNPVRKLWCDSIRRPKGQGFLSNGVKGTERHLWIGLGILVILTPLGVLSQKTAWGEWTGEELRALLGFIPEKLKQSEHILSVPFPDYSLTGSGGPAEYLLSAVVGCVVVVAAAVIMGRLLR